MTPHDVDLRIAAALERLAHLFSNSGQNMGDDLLYVANKLRAETLEPTKPQPEPCVTPIVGRWCRLRNSELQWCTAFWQLHGGPKKYTLSDGYTDATGKEWNGNDPHDVVEVMPEGWEPTK